MNLEWHFEDIKSMKQRNLKFVILRVDYVERLLMVKFKKYYISENLVHITL